jgi:hypothetical protein
LAKGTCELCEREKPTTFHHLIPRRVHRIKRFKKMFTKAQMNEGVDLCKLCHDGIHDIIPEEKDLATHYNTKEKLLAHEGIAKHVEWAKKQK